MVLVVVFTVWWDLLRMCNIEMSDSAKELLEENDGYAPIIVGADYKNVVKIGSKYIDNESGKQYIVVDILSEGSVWIGNNTTVSGDIGTELDNLFVVPFDEFYLKDKYLLINECYKNNLYFYMDKNSNETNVINDINEIAEENNIFISVKSIDQVISNYKNEFKEYYKATYIFDTRNGNKHSSYGNSVLNCVNDLCFRLVNNNTIL